APRAPTTSSVSAMVRLSRSMRATSATPEQGTQRGVEFALESLGEDFTIWHRHRGDFSNPGRKSLEEHPDQPHGGVATKDDQRDPSTTRRVEPGQPDSLLGALMHHGAEVRIRTDEPG